MNHIWTEKDITQAVRRLQKYRDCEHRLVVKHIKSGNIPAQDWRNLMFKLVELGHAFDNGESCKSDKYQISINWGKQAEIFKPFFPSALLSWLDPGIIELPPIAKFGEFLSDIEMLLERNLTQSDLEKWAELQYESLTVRKMLCGFQTTGKFEIEKDNKVLLMGKDYKKYLILKAEEIAYMYKAIECGCIHKCIDIEYCKKSNEAATISLFIDLLEYEYTSKFIVQCLHPGLPNTRAKYDHVRNFISSYMLGMGLLKKFSEPLSENDLNNRKHEWNETKKDFLKACELMNKDIPPRLLDFVANIVSDKNSPNVYMRKLLDSSIPEVVEKAQKWADVALSGKYMQITQKAIRQQYDKSRSD